MNFLPGFSWHQALGLIVFFLFCGQARPVDTIWDRQARYLAGLPQRSSNPYEALQDERWKKLSQDFSTEWQAIEKGRLGKMQAWSQDHIPKNYQDLFYPFSGPDILSAAQFFPSFKQAVFIGLEPVGRVRDVLKDTPAARHKHLAALHASMRDLFTRSYFITLHMMGDFRTGRAEGVLPAMLVLLVRSGYSIENVRRVYIERTGKLLDFEYRPYPAGIKIDFSKNGQSQTVLYFTQNLSDSFLANNPGFGLYLKQMQRPACFTKSASYLMHYGEFQNIRSMLFQLCSFILQDDTGIALRYVDLKTWKVKLFGEYAPPIRDFKGVHQKDVAQMYKKEKAAALPFSMGYHWMTGKQNMLLFLRK